MNTDPILDGGSASQEPTTDGRASIVGTMIAGKYRVDRVLGSGGMGLVVQATHVALNQAVAIKLIRDDVARSPELIARFMREARAAAQLPPEHIARVTDVGQTEKGEPFRITSRMKLYAVVLTGLIALFLTLVFMRPAVEAMFLRAPGSLFMETADGKIENLYTLKLVNKTMRELPVELKLEGSAGQLEVMGEKNLVVPAGKLSETSVLIQLAPEVLTGNTTKLKVGVYSGGKRVQTVKTVFVGPRK